MIYEIFEQLLSNNSRLAKEAVLRSEIDNEILKRVCVLALNPYIRFHVRKTPDEYAGHGDISLSEAMDELSKFSNRELTGNAAVSHLESLFRDLSVDDAKVLKKIIDGDLKCGVSISTVNKIWPKLIPEFEIQLATGFDEKKISKRFAVEPKIDGMRVIVMNEDGNFTFMTRSGRELETLDHLIPDIMELMSNTINYVLDTEVTSGGSLESTVSAVKRDGKAKGVTNLNIFDYLTLNEFNSKKCERIYEERRKTLVNLFDNYDGSNLILNPSVQYDPSNDLSPLEYIREVFGEHRKAGIEGTIVKDLDGLYEFDRTTAWMKVKPFEHKDVEITGYYAGRKGTKNENRLGGFTFDDEGVESRVGGGFSDDQRDEFWAIRNEMIGEIIEIEFMEKTKKGATRHCNFIMRRNYKGAKA